MGGVPISEKAFCGVISLQNSILWPTQDLWSHIYRYVGLLMLRNLSFAWTLESIRFLFYMWHFSDVMQVVNQRKYGNVRATHV